MLSSRLFQLSVNKHIYYIYNYNFQFLRLTITIVFIKDKEQQDQLNISITCSTLLSDKIKGLLVNLCRQQQK